MDSILALCPCTGQKLVGVSKIPRRTKGVGISATVKVTLDDLTVEAILSSDFLEMHKCVIDVNGVVKRCGQAILQRNITCLAQIRL